MDSDSWNLISLKFNLFSIMLQRMLSVNKWAWQFWLTSWLSGNIQNLLSEFNFLLVSAFSEDSWRKTEFQILFETLSFWYFILILFIIHFKCRIRNWIGNILLENSWKFWNILRNKDWYIFSFIPGKYCFLIIFKLKFQSEK